MLGSCVRLEVEQCENRCVQLVPCPHSAHNKGFFKFPPLPHLSPGRTGHVSSPKSRSGMKGDYLKMGGWENSGDFAGHWLGNGQWWRAEGHSHIWKRHSWIQGRRALCLYSWLWTNLSLLSPGLDLFSCTWHSVRVLLCPTHPAMPLLVSSSQKVCPAPSESWKGDLNPQSVKEKARICSSQKALADFLFGCAHSPTHLTQLQWHNALMSNISFSFPTRHRQNVLHLHHVW